jgi:hypothetical protein
MSICVSGAFSKSCNFHFPGKKMTKIGLNVIGGRLGHPCLEELVSLSHERDPQLFYESLLNLGMRLEARDRLQEATAIYEAIIAQPLESIGVPGYRGIGEKTSASNSPKRRNSVTPILAQRAQERLDAINGVGSSAARLEFNFRRITHEAASPTGLFAMGAAGAAFRLTKLAALSRLATTPIGFLGRQAIAHSAAFIAESTTFTLAGKTANQIAGVKQDWSTRTLAQEWTGGAAMLLGLKAMGGLTNAAVRRLGVGAHGRGPLQQLSQMALPQFGMFTGIMLGNKLSEFGGFREHHDNATALVDSLTTLLQFNVSGRLFNGVMGEGFRKWEQRVDLQSEALARRYSDTSTPRYFPVTSPFATAGGPVSISNSSLQTSHSDPPHVHVADLNLHSMKMSANHDGLAKHESSESDSFEDLPSEASGVRSSFERDDSSREGKNFPYVKLPDGTFAMARPNMTVAVLGDVGGIRTFELASQGHHVMHIDYSPLTMLLAQDMVQSLTMQARREGKLMSDPQVTFLQKDWYQVHSEADLVEAFFPLTGGDLPMRGSPSRVVALKNFLSLAMNSKLSPKGSAFVISEQKEIIEELAQIIREDARLELLERKFNENKPPLIGGFSKNRGTFELDHWLVYRRKDPVEQKMSSAGSGSVKIYSYSNLSTTQSDLVDFLGRGPETSIERRLREDPPLASHEMCEAIAQLIEELPGGFDLQFPFGKYGGRLESHRLLIQGQVRHRRLEALHRLLSEGRDLSQLVTIENGAGPVPDVAITLARMGAKVIIKEPEDINIRSHRRVFESLDAHDLHRKMTYIPRDEIDEPYPADIVYWPNPSPNYLNYPFDFSLPDYLGRDVRPGGYLVLQNDLHGNPDRYASLSWNPQDWETIFRGRLSNVSEETNYVLPTLTPDSLFLQIYKRRSR